MKRIWNSLVLLWLLFLGLVFLGFASHAIVRAVLLGWSLL